VTRGGVTLGVRSGWLTRTGKVSAVVLKTGSSDLASTLAKVCTSWNSGELSQSCTIAEIPGDATETLIRSAPSSPPRPPESLGETAKKPM
jgi:hypothetical protein